MSTPHKHAALIKAWADGAEIQVKSQGSNEFRDIGTAPAWSPMCDYRIKPKTPIVRYGEIGLRRIYTMEINWFGAIATNGEIKATFDPETGELLTIEKL